MKRVLFTEAQLKNIIGEEEFSSYLDKSDFGYDISSDSNVDNYEEVIPTDNIDNKETFDTDLYSHEKTQTHPWLRRGYYSLYENSEEVQNMHCDLGKVTKSNISSNTNSKMLQHIKNGTGDNLGANKTRLTRLRQSKKDNPALYNQNGGKKMEKALSDAVKQTQGLNNTNREISRNNIKQLETPDYTKGFGKGNHKSTSQNIYYEQN